MVWGWVEVGWEVGGGWLGGEGGLCWCEWWRMVERDGERKGKEMMKQTRLLE